MRPKPRARSKFRLQGVAAAALACCVPLAGWSADTDIYGPPGAAGGGPNVVFLLDNTSNWSANNQAWKKSDVLAKCNTKPADQKALCQNYVGQVFGAAADLTQGQVQLRALKLVLNELVCNAGAAALDINMGLSLLSKQSTLNNGHPVGVINFAVQPLVTTVAAGNTKSSCARLVEQLDLIDSKIQDPDWKAPSDANYGAAYYEIFKYFGGHSNPNLAGNPNPNGGSPLGETGYGPIRFSKKNVLDDPAAFTNGTARTTYTSPLSGAAACGNNYVVLVGNTYPNAEPSNGGPVRFQDINYTPPTLSAVTSDTSRFADEWSYFMANTDVSDAPGQQRVFSYAINTYNDKPDANQGKLLKSMAAVGGIGAGGYLEVGGDLYALILAFKKIFFDIASRNSVFTATTLPVSTTTQGTFLNQVFVGMFRPDAKGSPRWVGNLKQYQLGVDNNKLLTLVDKNGASATLGGAGFFSPSAVSFWSETSVFFDQQPSGTPASASDLPDGAIVEKGGAAFQLRKKYIGTSAASSAAGRNVKTLNSTLDALADFSVLPATPTDLVMPAWIRGMSNVPATDPGAEAFIGSYDNAGTPALLGATGARHSMHGDVLHSRPVALNYGSSGVVVYYGANDGFLRAVDGNKTGTTAGQELWSFIAPEHYGLFGRLRNGTPLLHLPETDKYGATVAPPIGTETKSYGMDGPIGVYAKYGAGANPSVSEAFIYPTMRRGGRSVYAFNVSNPTSPTFKWRIVGGVTSGFSNLAQTWSMPKAVVFKSASAQAPMLIMGGGYDEAEDTNGSSGVGNAIYIVNGDTGAHIKTLTTDYSVPSDVTVIDVNFDGQPDRAYVADVRGNLYRIDFPASAPLSPASWTSVQAVKIANVGGKVFFPPDVVVTKNFVAVMVGTGDREKPLLESNADHFVMVKDTLPTQPDSGTVVTLSDLAHIGSVDKLTMNMVPTDSPGSKAKGCYISLAEGEKVVNAPFTIAGATYFGTNRPPPDKANVCSANLGEAYAYKFPLFCEVPAKPSQILGGGLPPSPVGGIVTIDIGGVPTQMPFLIGGSGPSAFDVAEPTPPIPPIRTRQHWRIDNSNR